MSHSFYDFKFYLMPNNDIVNIDVRQERQHSDLIHDVETFKTGKLKHADTKEKIVLPNATGTSHIGEIIECCWA